MEWLGLKGRGLTGDLDYLLQRQIQLLHWNNTETLLELDTLPGGHPYAIMGQTNMSDQYIRPTCQSNMS